MAETVVVTDLSTTVTTVKVSDSGPGPAVVNVSDVAALTGMQGDRLNSVDEGAVRDEGLLYRLWEWASAITFTGADTELPTGFLPAPYFRDTGGRILIHCEGPVAAAFASTITLKLKAVRSGVTTTIATFTSAALTGGASAGHWECVIRATGKSATSQRLKATFEYQDGSGAQVRKTLWADGTFDFSTDCELRVDGSVGAGTLVCDYSDAFHFGRRTGTW